MAEQVPSVGRVVHYVAYGTPGGEYPAGAHRAAIVTDVHNPDAPESVLSLCVLNPTGLLFAVGVYYSADGAPGTWHWPEFVPPQKGAEE
jgi:hypothetical protein